MNTREPIVSSMRSDKGRIYDHNEDFVTCWEPTTQEEEQQHGWFYIVADGVGGAEAGEVASQYASERVKEHYLNDEVTLERGERLRQAMQRANTELRQLVATQPESRRMATTMVTTVIANQQATIANVGDSRAYLWRSGLIQQITKDQSLVAKLVEEGAISEAEAENHPYQNVILYSIGSDRNPKIDLFEVALIWGDILVMCSDGLIKHVSNVEIGDHVSRREPDEATAALIKLANERGGRDNISVAVLRYGRHPLVQMLEVPETAVDPQPLTRPMYSPTPLWLFTILLSFVQIILTYFVWTLLHV